MVPGERIGSYRLVSELARGGMGVVYRALAPDGQEVALKLLHVDSAPADRDKRERFLREALALARLRHPHVVRVLDAGLAGGTPFMAMELVRGEDLAGRIARQGPLPVREAVELVRKLAGAVAHAHAHGVLHRDLKPSNVLVRLDGEPALTDFGLTRDVDLERSRSHTRTGRFMGSPGYWAPEQARGRTADMGPHTDVYGLGAVLVALLTGQPPQGTPRTMLEALTWAARPVAPPSSRRPEVDPALDAICLRALAGEPADRHPSAAALEQELAGWLRRKAAPPHARRAAPLIAAALLLLGALGGVAVLQRGRSDQGVPAPEGAVVPPASASSPGLPAAVSNTGDEEVDARALAGRLFQLSLRANAGDEAARATLEAELAQLSARSERLLGATPVDPRGFLYRALVCQARGDAAGAESALRAGLAEAPGDMELHTHLVQNLVNQGRLEEAERCADAALEHDPRCVPVILARGVVRERRGDLHGMLADNELAMSLAPEDPLIWFNRGALRERIGETAGALADYSRALELDPSHEGSLLNRAILRAQVREDQGALSDLDRLLELRPDHAPALASRALLRRENGLLQESEADCGRLIELAPGSSDGWCGRAQTRYAQGRLVEALADADRWVGLSPSDPGARLLRATLFERLGDERALEEYRACQALSPREPLAEQVRRAIARLSR